MFNVNAQIRKKKLKKNVGIVHHFVFLVVSSAPYADYLRTDTSKQTRHSLPHETFKIIYITTVFVGFHRKNIQFYQFFFALSRAVEETLFWSSSQVALVLYRSSHCCLIKQPAREQQPTHLTHLGLSRYHTSPLRGRCVALKTTQARTTFRLQALWWCVCWF